MTVDQTSEPPPSLLEKNKSVFILLLFGGLTLPILLHFIDTWRYERIVTAIERKGGVYLRDPSRTHGQIFELTLNSRFVSDTGRTFIGPRVTDADLAMLSRLNALQFLSLRNAAITDAGLVHLTALPRLKKIDLSGTHVTPAGIDRLKRAVPGLVVRFQQDPHGPPPRAPHDKGTGAS